MKWIVTLFSLSAPLFALNVVLNSGKENKINYALLHLIDTEPFVCETLPDVLEKKRYLCVSQTPFANTIEPKKTKFAELYFYEKEGTFYIAIEPKVASRLVPVEDTLYETKELLAKPKQERYTHWTIMLEEAPLYPEKPVVDGIDFPIYFEKYQKPYIGALDLNGAPISYAQSKDIDYYIEIKRAYAKERYEDVIESVKLVLSQFPHSLFKSEMELYLMRSMDKLLSTKGEEVRKEGMDEESLVAMGKRWTKEFPSDEGIPEVFMMMAKSYLKLNLKSDANYFIDILISEYPQSPSTKKAILYFADNLLAKKEKDKAAKLYLEVLYSVNDMDIASEAAIRLGDVELSVGKIDEAKAYLRKVLSVNSAFLLKDKEASYALAKRLHERKLDDIAAAIVDVLLERIPKEEEQREQLLKESGDWHALAGEVEKAYARYQDYLREYKEGEYAQEVKERLDELFFKREESNESKLLEHYDTLIQTYQNAISEKALIEKAKLLLKQGHFEEVLALKESLLKVPDTYGVVPESLLYEAAQALALKRLDEKKCSDVVTLTEVYQLQFAQASKEKELFECFLSLSRFEKAKEISALHVKDKALEDRFIWLQKHAIVLMKMGNTKEIHFLKNDIEALSKTLKKPIELETLRTFFFALLPQKELEEVLAITSLAQTLYPDTFSHSDLYYEIVKKAYERKDDLLLVSYAEKIVALQETFKAFPLSPSIEFYYTEALKRLGKLEEARSLMEQLSLQSNLTPSDRIRLFYNAGEISLKQGDQAKAKAYFSQCVDINATSSWKSICEENLKLFE